MSEMKTLAEWLKEQRESNAYPASWEHSEYVLREAYPRALRIIEALTTIPEDRIGRPDWEWHFAQNREVAEAVINERSGS